MEIAFGQYALPVVLTMLLGFIFKITGVVPDRWKSVVAVLLGVGLGMVGIAYNGMPWTVVNIVDYSLYGFMTGASAVGIYELQRAARNPRD